MSSSDPVSLNILEELVYFDLFNCPLTTFEIWNNLRQRFGNLALASIQNLLSRDAWLKERVSTAQGRWCLRGREANLRERQIRYRASKHKIDKAQRFVRLARFIPWAQEIHACNSLGFLHARQESDIDLFVVVKRGRIWSTRFFMILLAKCFGRPTRAHTKDRLCLSFFAAQGANLKKVALGSEDVYFWHWLGQRLCLYARKAGQRRNSKLGDWLERALRRMQLKLMPGYLRALANKGTAVVLNDEFLKFHDHDKREYFRKEYAARLAAVSA